MHTVYKNSHTDKKTITKLLDIIVQVRRKLDDTSAARLNQDIINNNLYSLDSM